MRALVVGLIATGALGLAGPEPLSARAADAGCATCSCNGDRDGDGVVTVDEVIAAVNNLLDGCPPLHWQQACGPPAERLDDCPAGLNYCSTEQVGDPCDAPQNQCCVRGTKCTGFQCNEELVCAVHPPTDCPISRRAYKHDIQYLTPDDVAKLSQQLCAFRLARYRYTSEGPMGAERLGFIIDDVEPSPAVDRGGNAVDLYGYLSMSVAALQTQARDIDALHREIGDLRRRVDEAEAKRGRAP